MEAEGARPSVPAAAEEIAKRKIRRRGLQSVGPTHHPVGRRHRAGSLDHTGREWCRLNLGRKGRVLRLARGIEPIEQVWIEHRYELGDRAIKRGGHVLDLGIID